MLFPFYILVLLYVCAPLGLLLNFLCNDKKGIYLFLLSCLERLSAMHFCCLLDAICFSHNFVYTLKTCCA